MKNTFRLTLMAAGTFVALGHSVQAQPTVTTPVAVRQPITCGLPCSGQPPISVNQPVVPTPIPVLPVAPINCGLPCSGEHPVIFQPIAAPSPVIGPVPVGPTVSIPGQASAPYIPVLVTAESVQAANGAAFHAPVSGTPILGGLVTVVETPEAPMGAGITIVNSKG